MSKVLAFFVTFLLWNISQLGYILGQKQETSSTLPMAPNCGMPLSDRLIGGIYAQIDEIPWTALIEYRKSNGQTGIHCGGALINSRYVLTAAHCTNSIPKGWKIINVRLGEWDQDQETDCLHNFCNDAPLNSGIEKIVVHENYVSGPSHLNDIALIRLNKSVEFSDLVSPVCLPIEDPQVTDRRVDSRGYASGWERSNQGNSNVKLKIPMAILDFKNCTEIYKRTRVTLADSHMCVKGFNSYEPYCKTLLSGSSFTREQYHKKYNTAFNYLYGILSMGPTVCGANDMPDVYTNIANYIDWIERNVE